MTETMRETARILGQRGLEYDRELSKTICQLIDTPEREQMFLEWLRKQETLTHGQVEDQVCRIFLATKRGIRPEDLD